MGCGQNDAWLAAFILLVMSSVALADRPEGISAQTITLPSGPTSLKGLGESFSPNPSMGNGNFSVPIQVVPGILAPKVSLQYSGGSGKTKVGLGFSLPVMNIYRTTDKGLPEYKETDRFAVSGGELNDELVLVNAQKGYYRLKNEGAFALFIRDKSSDSWTVKLANGHTLYLGTSLQSRQYGTSGTYRWYIETHEDRFGHKINISIWMIRGRCICRKYSYQNLAEAGAENSVVFTYERRPDVSTDYRYGTG